MAEIVAVVQRWDELVRKLSQSIELEIITVNIFPPKGMYSKLRIKNNITKQSFDWDTEIDRPIQWLDIIVELQKREWL